MINVLAEDGQILTDEADVDIEPELDVIPPTITAAAIDASGTTLSLVFSEPVVGVRATDYALSNGHTLSAAVGADANWSMSITPPVQKPDTENPTLSYVRP